MYSSRWKHFILVPFSIIPHCLYNILSISIVRTLYDIQTYSNNINVYFHIKMTNLIKMPDLKKLRDIVMCWHKILYYPIRTSTDPFWTKSLSVSLSSNPFIVNDELSEESICSVFLIVVCGSICCVTGVVIDEVVCDDSVTSGSFVKSKVCSVSILVVSFGLLVLGVWKFNSSELSSYSFWLNPFCIKYQSPIRNPQSWLGSKDKMATIYKNLYELN